MLMLAYFSPFYNPLHSCLVKFQYFSNHMLRIALFIGFGYLHKNTSVLQTVHNLLFL